MPGLLRVNLLLPLSGHKMIQFLGKLDLFVFSKIAPWQIVYPHEFEGIILPCPVYLRYFPYMLCSDVGFFVLILNTKEEILS